MPKCGGLQECSEDAISLDDLENEDCVSFTENNEENGCSNKCEHLCVSCNTAAVTRKGNQLSFDKDPVNILFSKVATRSQTKKLRELLKERCNIDSKEPQIEPLKEIHEFSEKDINSYVESIKKKFNPKQAEVYTKYVDLMQKTLAKTKKWNTMIKNHTFDSDKSLQEVMKQDILVIITELGIPNIGFSHAPRELLSGCFLFLQQASMSSSERVLRAYRELYNARACFEGVITIAERVFYE